MPMLKLGFLASNNGSGMRALVAAIEAGSLEATPAILVSNKARAPILEFARAHSVATHVIPTLADPIGADIELCRVLKEAGVGLVVLSGYLRKLGLNTLTAFDGRIINTHPALLPAYGGKGMYGRRVHEAVAAAGERESGATIHLVDGEYDHGAILAQRGASLPARADAATIERIVMAEEEVLLIETVGKIARGELPSFARR